jgi:hypothetical protein
MSEKVPNPEAAAQRKSRRRRLFNSIPVIVDQAAINAGFGSRRQAMKPGPSTWAVLPLGFAGSTALHRAAARAYLINRHSRSVASKYYRQQGLGSCRPHRDLAVLSDRSQNGQSLAQAFYGLLDHNARDAGGASHSHRR